MAISLGATVAGAEDAALTGYTADSGSDRVLVFCGSHEGGGGTLHDITAVTYNAVSMTEVAGAEAQLEGNSAEIFIMKEASIASGSNDFAVTHTNGLPAAGYLYVALTLISVDQTTPVADSNAATASTAQGVSTTATAVADGYSVSVFNQGKSGTTVWTSPYTEQWDYSGSSCVCSVATNAESSSGTTTAEATGSGATSNACIGLVTFEPAGAPPGGRVMSSLTGFGGGLAGHGGIAGIHGGLAA